MLCEKGHVHVRVHARTHTEEEKVGWVGGESTVLQGPSSFQQGGAPPKHTLPDNGANCTSVL